MSLCRKNVIITIDFYRKYPTSTSSTYLPTTIGMRNKIWNLLFICHENLATKFRSTHIFLFYHVKYYYGLGWKATQAGRSDLLLLMCVSANCSEIHSRQHTVEAKTRSLVSSVIRLNPLCIYSSLSFQVIQRSGKITQRKKVK